MLFNIHKFKKISADKDNTVLQHPDGHTITINHSALGPKMRKQLMALEIHDKAPAMDQGGAVCTDKKTGTQHSCTPDDFLANSDKRGWSSNSTPDKSKEGGDPSANPDTKDLQKGFGYAKGGSVRAMDDGGQIPGGNGSPSIDPQKAKEMQDGATQPGTTLSQGWQNLKSAAGYAKGGQVRAMADGGGDAPLEVEPVDPNSPDASAQDPNDSGDTSSETAPPGTPQVGAPAPAPQAAAPVNPADQGPQQSQAQDPSAGTPDGQSGANPPDAATPPPTPMTPQEIQAGHRDGLLAEDQAWEQDLKNGHITPETMSSLFAKKDTLGKVRSIFGILLGGIGSGLTHQPNAALAMMQKQIDNDVNAQVNSKSNARNAYQLHLQNELQKAQIPQMVAQGKLSTAQAKVAEQDAAQKAYALTRMTANRSALHDAVTANAALPEGSPQRKAGDQALALMYQSVNNENFNIADRQAAASTLTGMSGGSGSNAAAMSSYGGPEAKAMVDFNQQHSIPGIEGQSTQPISAEDRNQVNAMNVLDQKGKDVLAYVQQHKGSIDPNVRSTAAQKVEEMKNFYNESIKGGALTEGRLDWYDQQFGKRNPTSIVSDLLGNNAKLREMIGSNANRRDEILHDKLGFPQYKNSGGAKFQKVPGGWKKVQ